MLTQAGSSIESYSGLHPAKKESLKVFFLVLQVCHLLMAGQVGFILSLKLCNLLVESRCAISKQRFQRMMLIDICTCFPSIYYFCTSSKIVAFG